MLIMDSFIIDIKYLFNHLSTNVLVYLCNVKSSSRDLTFSWLFNDCDILLSWVEKYPKLFKKPGKRQCNLFSRLKVCFVLDLAWGEGGGGKTWEKNEQHFKILRTFSLNFSKIKQNKPN